ncbi:MAG: hypothetical protein ACOYXT_30365 [Bacteroidota bacterium]
MLRILEAMIVAADFFFDLDQLSPIALHLGLKCIKQDFVVQIKHHWIWLDGLEVFDNAIIGNLSFESFRTATGAMVVEILATIATRSTTRDIFAANAAFQKPP